MCVHFENCHFLLISRFHAQSNACLHTLLCVVITSIVRNEIYFKSINKNDRNVLRRCLYFRETETTNEKITFVFFIDSTI